MPLNVDKYYNFALSAAGAVILMREAKEENLQLKFILIIH